MANRRTLTLAVAGWLSATPFALTQQPPARVAPKPISSPYGSAEAAPAAPELMPTTVLNPMPAMPAEPGVMPMQPMPPAMQPRYAAMASQPVPQRMAVQQPVMMVPAQQPMMQMVPVQGQYVPMPTEQYAPLPAGQGAMMAGPQPLMPVAPAQPMSGPAHPTAPLYTSGQGGCGPQGCGTPACGVPQNACGAPTCNTCEPQKPCPCGPYGQYWIAPEYIAWATKGSYVPPLVTTSPDGTPRNQAGVIGQPGTTVLYGGGDTNDDLRSGFRLRGGFWLDCCQTHGIDGSIFYLGSANDNALFSSSGTPILARPFVNNGTNDSQLVAFRDTEIVGFPGIAAGSVKINNTTDLWGADLNYRHNLCCCCDYRVDLLLGYRYLRLYDNLQIVESVTSTDTASPVPVNTNFLLSDSFTAENQFHGGQVGLAGEVRRGNFYVAAAGKVALGNVRQTVTIAGSTRTSIPGQAATTTPGGLLAQQTNSGAYARSEFAVLPEVTLNLGYQVTQNLRAFVGYNFLYLSNVVRASEQIDTTLNLSQLPPGTLVGPARPAFQFKDTDFWAQGISGGIELRY